MKPRTSPAPHPFHSRASLHWARALGTAAALSAITLAAQAQPAAGPGLQVYGLVDAAVGRFAGPAAGINAQDRAVTKLDGGGMSTSHWGLRGTEDLGGGLSAQFELSSFVRNDSGATGRTSGADTTSLSEGVSLSKSSRRVSSCRDRSGCPSSIGK